MRISLRKTEQTVVKFIYYKPNAKSVGLNWHINVKDDSVTSLYLDIGVCFMLYFNDELWRLESNVRKLVFIAGR